MIYRDQDVKINVTVTQTYKTAQGNTVTEPVDLTVFDGYIIVLYSKETNVIIEKYSKNADTGYVLINETDPTNGEVQLFLDKDVTNASGVPDGDIYGELKTSLADADFSTGQYFTVAVFPVDTLKNSVTKTLIPKI